MEKINPLANPKGVKLVCELCGKVAYIQCQFCKVTYYCSKEHQATDWSGIHVKICQSLIPLRVPSKVLGSEEERARREKNIKKNQLALLELSRSEAQKHLHESQYELSIPAALQSLRFAVDLFGPASIELVPSYLLLGEASIGLSRFQQAEEYLSLAKYAVLKKPDCSHSLRSQLHRNFGRLYSSQGKYEDAVYQLANDVYYSSLQFGPENISTTGGYFQLGNVFALKSQQSSALAMFEKVVEIWYAALTTAIKTLEQTNVEIIDEAMSAECLQMLQRILTVREQNLGNVHTATGESYHILGMVYRYLRNYQKAKDHTEKALNVFISAVGGDHPSTVMIKKSLTTLDALLKEGELQ